MLMLEEQLLLIRACNVTITESKFQGNSAEIGEAIFATRGADVMITNSTFGENFVTCKTSKNICVGGVLYPFHGEGTMSQNRTQVALSINQSTFWNNTANRGGVLVALEHTIIKINQSTFWNNTANNCGGFLFY